MSSRIRLSGAVIIDPAVCDPPDCNRARVNPLRSWFQRLERGETMRRYATQWDASLAVWVDAGRRNCKKV